MVPRFFVGDADGGRLSDNIMHFARVLERQVFLLAPAKCWMRSMPSHLSGSGRAKTFTGHYIRFL